MYSQRRLEGGTTLVLRVRLPTWASLRSGETLGRQGRRRCMRLCHPPGRFGQLIERVPEREKRARHAQVFPGG